MLFVDTTFDNLDANLAFDEALIDEAESGRLNDEVLRVWDAHETFIVVGRSSKLAVEVNVESARKAGIPIRRRFSGGATVLAASGCFLYGVLVSLVKRPHLRMLDEAHRFVMGKVSTAVREHVPQVNVSGICDLVLDNLKVGGNSLRVQRDWLFYHGTLLIDMDLGLVDKFLPHPPREPEYRAGRAHTAFLGNLHVKRSDLTNSLRSVWDAQLELKKLPLAGMHRLVEEKYSTERWNNAR